MPKPLTVWITTNCGKFLKRWEYQTTLPASWEICMQVKKQQLEPDTEQQIGSKLGKEYVKAVYCHPAYLTYMQSTSWEMLDWMKHKMKSRLQGEISITSYMRMTPLLWQKAKRNLKILLMKVKEESEVGLKLKIQKTKIMTSGPIESEVAQLCPTLCDPMDCTRLLSPWNFPGKSTGVGYFMANRWGNSGNSDRLNFLRLQNHCNHEMKRYLFLGRKVFTNLAY